MRKKKFETTYNNHQFSPKEEEKICCRVGHLDEEVWVFLILNATMIKIEFIPIILKSLVFSRSIYMSRVFCGFGFSVLFTFHCSNTSTRQFSIICDFFIDSH